MPRRPQTQLSRAAIPRRARSNGRAARSARGSRRAVVGRRWRVGTAGARFGRGCRSRGGLGLRLLLAAPRPAAGGTILAAVDPDALDPPRVGIEHLELKSAR